MYYPVVFVRGYAATKNDVENAVSDPHRGFNIGSSIIKLTNNPDSADQSKAFQHDFPGPLLRLIQEHNYRDALTNRFVSPQNEPFPNVISADTDGKSWRKTVWIFDIYGDEYFGGERPQTEGYAEQLALFLNQIREAAGHPSDFKVNLVAHSMGGLVCRCYIQNKQLFERTCLQKIKPVLVNKLVTYGTPHKGIDFRRGLEFADWIKNIFGPLGSDSFGEPRMREFLSLATEPLHTLEPARKDVTAENTFSIIGTNFKVYDVLFGLSSKAVGPRSDGLVLIDNAYICSGPRAYINCSHSGYMGLINSEAGYQNLIRFLFGDFRYQVMIKPLIIQNSKLREPDQKLDYLTIESTLAIRGLPSYLSCLSLRDGNALSIELTENGNDSWRQSNPEDTTLFVNFLDSRYQPEHEEYMEGAIDLKIEQHYKTPRGVLGFLRPTRLEGEFVFNDRLHIRLKATNHELQYYWGAQPDWKTLAPAMAGEGANYTIPFPSYIKDLLQGEGLCISTSTWQ